MGHISFNPNVGFFFENQKNNLWRRQAKIIQRAMKNHTKSIDWIKFNVVFFATWEVVTKGKSLDHNTLAIKWSKWAQSIFKYDQMIAIQDVQHSYMVCIN